MQKPEKRLNPWHMGTHMRMLSESYLMTTNMTRFDGFQKSFRPCALLESCLNIGRVNQIRYREPYCFMVSCLTWWAAISCPALDRGWP